MTLVVGGSRRIQIMYTGTQQILAMGFAAVTALILLILLIHSVTSEIIETKRKKANLLKGESDEI